MKRIIAIGIILMLIFAAFKIEKSIGETLHDYIPHPPIYINGNNDFIPENGVVRGNGTKENPYIIEGWKINAKNATGMMITNTDAYFVIKRCFIYGGRSIYNPHIGIFLENVRNGRIDETFSVNNWDGIQISNCENIEVSDCNIFGNYASGIRASSSSHIKISGCDISNNDFGIEIVASSNNHIYNCNITDNRFGIHLGLNRFGISATKNIICYCNLANNYVGINILLSCFNVITHNNFIKNSEDVYFYYTSIFLTIVLFLSSSNFWYKNYWDNWRIPIPKPIIGEISSLLTDMIFWQSVPWIQFDLMPSLKPIEWWENE